MDAVGILILFLIGAVVGWKLLIRSWEKTIEPEYDPDALWIERLQELNREHPYE